MYSFPNSETFFVLYPVPTVASYLAYRFLRRQVRWSGIPISWRIFQFVVIHTVKGFGIVNDTEVDVFLGTNISSSYAANIISWQNTLLFSIYLISQPVITRFCLNVLWSKSLCFLICTWFTLPCCSVGAFELSFLLLCFWCFRNGVGYPRNIRLPWWLRW